MKKTAIFAMIVALFLLTFIGVAQAHGGANRVFRSWDMMGMHFNEMDKMHEIMIEDLSQEDKEQMNAMHEICEKIWENNSAKVKSQVM